MPPSPPRLTDDEGTFLALILRIGPATAYQVSKVYEESPVSNFGTSKGKIYPLIRRLKERGLLKSRPVRDDARGSETLECTRSGREAVRRWTLDIRPNHLILEDPLRTKVQSFDLLTREEQMDWIGAAKTALQEKLDELDVYSKEVLVPYKSMVHDNAVTTARCRIEWLDRLLVSIGGADQRDPHRAPRKSAKP